MIKLKLIRNEFLPDRTLGKLLLSGQHGDTYFAYTLEDTVREPGVKIPGQTAIPAGRYEMVVDRSNRFSALAGHDVYLPRLLNVPNFEGIRIHAGNSPLDSAGCILIGSLIGTDNNLKFSKAALSRLMTLLKNVRAGTEQCVLEISEQRNKPETTFKHL